MNIQKLKLYSDFNQTKLIGEYDVEFKDNRARVHSNIFIVPVVSRFAKLNKFGGTSGGGEETKSFYQLTVNGNKVYFTSTYNIPTK